MISAALKTELTAKENEIFNRYAGAHPETLTVRKLEELPADMIGASYFIENDADGVSFACIRARQSNDTSVGVWKFVLGNPETNPVIRQEKDRTMEFLRKNDITLG